MPINPNIVGQLRAPEYHSPIGAISQLAQLQGVLSKRQQDEQVRGIMSQARTPEEAIPLLMKAGPAGLQAAGSLTQLLERSTKAKEASDKAAFFSPQNQQQYAEGARSAVELPEDMTGPVMPAQPGQMNFGRMLQDAASRNFVPPETYANHLAQREQAKETALLRRDTLDQNTQLRRDSLEQRAELAKQRSEDQRLTERERIQARMDLARLAASLKSHVTVNPAVTVSRIQDPDDPTRMLEVDARTYRGGSVGSPGVIGLSGREGDAQKREGKRQFGMQGIGAAITEAEKLLTDKAKPPTGSGVGAAVDYAGSFVGYSPGGAVEAQKLKVAGGALVSKVPRMEGPQSDKDLILYKEMAGMVGDATIPIDRRIAALDTVKLMWEKYERLNPGTFSDRRAGEEPPPGAVRRK